MKMPYPKVCDLAFGFFHGLLWEVLFISLRAHLRYCRVNDMNVSPRFVFVVISES